MLLKLKNRDFHYVLLIALTMFSSLAMSRQAQAYGNLGHYTIANVAEARLTPKARAEVNRLLMGASMAEVSHWANDFEIDDIGDMPNRRSLEQLLKQESIKAFTKSRFARDSESWHETYMPLFQTSYSEWKANKFNVPDASIDLVQIIDLCVASLRGEEAATVKIPRNVALMLLIHFVGDIHQPLHTAQAYLDVSNPQAIVIRDGSKAIGQLPDRGGSIIQLSGSKSLHGFWDETIVKNACASHLLSKELSLSSSRNYALWLTSNLQSLEKEEAGHPFIGGTERWFNESHKVAVEKVYIKKYLPIRLISRPGSTYRYKIEDLALDYKIASLSVVDRQLQLAGIRLAGLLNSIFDQEPSTNSRAEFSKKGHLMLTTEKALSHDNNLGYGFKNLFFSNNIINSHLLIQSFPTAGIARNQLGLAPEDDHFGEGIDYYRWIPINSLHNNILMTLTNAGWKTIRTVDLDKKNQIRKLTVISYWKNVKLDTKAYPKLDNWESKVAIQIKTPSTVQTNCWELKITAIQARKTDPNWEYASKAEIMEAVDKEVEKLINSIRASQPKR